MSCAEGTLARTGPKEFTRVEKLFEGANLYGAQGEEPALVTEPLQFAMRPCVKVKTDTGQQLVCEKDDALMLAGADCVGASESLRRTIITREGVAEVISVRRVGPRRVVMVHAEPAQPYEANGILIYRSELDG
jgi:hypothetical protein